MLDTVWVVQLLALVFVLPMVGGLVGSFHWLNRNLWPYFYLIFLYMASAFQAWQAPFEARWVGHTAFGLLVIATVVGLPHLLRTLRDFVRSDLGPSVVSLGRFPRFAFYLLSIALCIELLFAAFPGYRYDQYNYHLITPKLIALYGKLPPYMGTDPTHFTGAWEYFFTSFRTLLGNDLLIQTSTTTFTFLGYVIPSSAFLWHLARPKKWRALWFVGLPALVIYAHSELEPIISAKPDFILVAAALGIVAAQKLAVPQRFFFSFFFLVAGLSFKVTWFHAAAALGLGFLFCLWRDRLKHSPSHWFRAGFLPALGGAALAALCIWPVFYKNILIFGNPIHPTQAGPFKSAVATQQFLTYWEGISKRPSGISATLANIAQVLPREVMLLGPLIPVLLMCAWYGFKALKRESQHAPRRASVPLAHLRPWLLAWVVYLVVWGIILRFDIFNRFVAVVSIFPLLLIAHFARYLPSAGILALGLLTPFAINSATEVKLRRMWKGALQSYDEYSRDNFSPSIQDFREAKIIHAHARENFGENWRQACHIFTNKPNHYFFNTRFIAFDDQNFEYHINTFGREAFEKCPWAYFKSIKACYLLATHELEFSQWPAPMARLADAATFNFATNENSDLRLLFVSPEAIEAKMRATPGCFGVLNPQTNTPGPAQSPHSHEPLKDHAQ